MPLVDSGLGRKGGKNSPKRGKLGIQTPPKPPRRKSLTNRSGSSSSPSGVDASFSSTHSSFSSSTFAQSAPVPHSSESNDAVGEEQPCRIVEYNLKPAANDNVGAGLSDTAGDTTMNSADNGDYDCTGETIEVMTRGTSGLTLISSPPAPTLPSSPSRRGKLDNKLSTKKDAGAAKDDALTLTDDTSTTSAPTESVGSDNKNKNNNSSTPSKKPPRPSYWDQTSSPNKMSPRALNLKKKVMSISGKKKDKSEETVVSRENENKSCFFSGQAIEKGGAYYYATDVLSGAGSAGEDKDNHPRRLYTLSSSMKLLGCPTICDDDLRRMDKLYFTKMYRRLPEDLRLSSNWTRVAKHCTFSGRPIPDGVPFYYARRKAVGENGQPILGRFCYLRADVLWVNDSEGGDDEASKESNENEMDIRPLGPQDLMHLLANYPEVCGLLPSNILEDPSEWSLIDKFCFFSGGPIKADDTYYRANLDGKDIYLLVVLTPAVTARELFQLETRRPQSRGRQLLEELRKELIPLNVQEVEAMDRVYDLSFEDFDSLRERHYGSYLKLPRRLVDPSTWERVVPVSFLKAKEEAMEKAVAYEAKNMQNIPSAQKENSERGEFETSPTGDQSFLADLNFLVTKAKRGVQTLTCGAPQSFTLKELMQDDDSFLRELANEDRLKRGSHDENSIGTASLDNLKATLQRYSSRVGGQSVFSSDTRFTAGDFEMFDEFTAADDATFYTYATETTAGLGASKNKSYKPDLG